MLLREMAQVEVQSRLEIGIFKQFYLYLVKPLNVEKRLDKVLENNRLESLVIALGTSIEKVLIFLNLDITK